MVYRILGWLVRQHQPDEQSCLPWHRLLEAAERLGCSGEDCWIFLLAFLKSSFALYVVLSPFYAISI